MFFLCICRPGFLTGIISPLSEECLLILHASKAGWLMTNSLSFCLSEKLLIAPFLKDNFAWYRLVSWWVFSFYHFKCFTALYTCLHGLWRQVQCNFYYCFSIGKVFFASGFFQKLLSLIFHTLRYAWGEGVFILLGVCWASWICGLLCDANIGKFSIIIS